MTDDATRSHAADPDLCAIAEQYVRENLGYLNDDREDVVRLTLESAAPYIVLRTDLPATPSHAAIDSGLRLRIWKEGYEDGRRDANQAHATPDRAAIRVAAGKRAEQVMPASESALRYAFRQGFIDGATWAESPQVSRIPANG